MHPFRSESIMSVTDRPSLYVYIHLNLVEIGLSYSSYRQCNNRRSFEIIRINRRQIRNVKRPERTKFLWSGFLPLRQICSVRKLSTFKPVIRSVQILSVEGVDPRKFVGGVSVCFDSL